MSKPNRPSKESAKSRPRERLQDVGGRTVRFFRAYAEGVNQRDLTKLFDREASHAVTVLAGSDAEPQERRGFVGLLKLAWAFLRGLAFKLSPARRVLFAASLLVPLLSLLSFDGQIGSTRVAIDFAPLWFLLGLAGMTLLLALELVDRLRVRDELEVARALQRDLLPQAGPDLDGWRVDHVARTANEIGGDYYDFIPLADGRLAIAVGDASGHGIGAGLLMAIANATFKTALDVDPDPAEVLAQLNRVLYRTGNSRAFMTYFYALLEPDSGVLRYAIAGHPFPLLRRADGRVEELGEGGLPLGMRRELDFACGSAQIEPGDLLVLYTDGLPEAAGGADLEAFGFEQLTELVALDGTPSMVKQRVLTALDSHRGDEPLIDDLTLVVIGRESR